MSEIGGIFQLHDEVPALLQAVQSFSRFHARAPIVLFGNSAPHLAAASELTGLAGILSRPYMTPLHKLESENFQVDAATIESCIRTQVETLHSAFDALPAEFAVFLHPDHRVIRRVSPKTGLDLEINLVNRLSPAIIDQVEAEFRSSVAVPFWGIWGYMRRTAVIETCEWLLSDDVLARFLAIDTVFVYDDALLATAMQLRGYSVGTERFTRELRRTRGWRPWLRPTLLHQVALSTGAANAGGVVASGGSVATSVSSSAAVDADDSTPR